MTDTHFIPDELATRTARLINEAEDMRAQAVDDLKTIYGDLREELKALGWLGQSISKEVAAFKAAISEMRLDEEQKAKREEKGDRIDDYVALLSRSRAGARARTREGNAHADAKFVETIAAGVQTEVGRAALIAAVDIMIAREDAEDHEALAGTAPAVETSLAAREAEESAVSNSEIATASQGGTASPSPDAELSSAGANAGGEDVNRSAERANINAVASASGPDEKRATDLNANDDTAVVAISDVQGGVGSGMARTEASAVTAGETAPNSIAKPKYVLRPHCLNPGEACGGYSDKHCHACTVAMRKREQAEEVA